MDDLRFPIGQMPTPEKVSAAEIKKNIDTIKKLPGLLMKSTAHLKASQLNTVYRDGGWMIKQVVHHLADSHMNAYIRFKLALTEPNPTIKPYFESDWARLPDGNEINLKFSFMILEGVHHRWVDTMNNITTKQWNRTYFHPQHQESFTLKTATAIYAWHGLHHLAHINNLKKRKGWK